MLRRLTFRAVCALLLLTAAGAPAAVAQTTLSVIPNPAAGALQDRVDNLEAELRRATGENEKLQFELRKARDENALLRKTIDDMNSQSAGAPGGQRRADLPAVDSDPAVAYDNAYALIRANKHREAADAFAAFLQAYPNDRRAPDARYNLGQSLLVIGQPGEAASLFLMIVQKAPKAAIAPSAMLRLGVALNRMGQKDQACATLRSLPAQYPKAPADVKTAAQSQIKAIACPA